MSDNNYYSDVDEIISIKNNNSNKIDDSTNIPSLNNYIKSNRTQFGDKSLTHQWWDNEENTNFKITNNNYDNFLKIYIKELKKTDSILHVMEQPMEIGPLCLDFDFKQTTPQRKITIDNIMHIIGIINQIVINFYKITNKKILETYVMMKSEPFFNKKKLVYSDGFHLQYPNLILCSTDRFLIYHESRKEIIKQELFSDVYGVLEKVNYLKKRDNNTNIGLNLSDDNDNDNDLDSTGSLNNYYTLSDKDKEKINDEIFDPCVILKNKWFMYGSGKNIDGDINIYTLAYIFDYNVDKIDQEKSNSELVKILSIRKPSNEENQIKSKDSEEYQKLIEQIKLKYIKKHSEKAFDINNLFKQTTDNQVNIEENTKKKILDFTKNTFNKTPSEQENIIYAKELVKLLGKNRSILYDDWISVGWCLYNISPKLYPEFIEFSKLAGKKFDKAGCDKVWEDCIKRTDSTGYSIPSLIKWAKEDNHEHFKQLIRKKLNKTLDGRDLRTDFDVAHIVSEYYKYDYICSGIEKKVWWEFNNNRWNRIDSAYSLSIRLSTELALEFAQLQSDIIKLAIIEQGQTSDVLQKKSKTISDLIFNLKKSSFKDKIIKEAAGLFLQKDFESKLDQNIYLIGFSNGVYDLKTKIFRKGEPDDLIRKNVGYDYKEFKRDSPIIKEIEAFFESIQPDKDMRDYLGAYIASFLEGSNKDQKFMIWTGCGQNGKGSLIDLIDNTFGGTDEGYFATLPPTVLTQKRGSSSAATPELATKFGKRIIVLQEPEGDDKINVGFMKNITGQDKIEARPLYGDPFQYTPLFKLLLACNHLPNIPSDDGGTWRRIRVIDFMIKFTSNPQSPNERKSDSKLREKMKKWNQAFMWLLINVYYPMYVENDGLDKLEPERVKFSTNKYKSDSNVIMEFFNESLEKDDKSEGVSFNDIYETFKGWYINSYNDKKPLQRKKFREYFDINGFKVCSVTGRGIIIKGIKTKDHNLEVYGYNELDN
jgi:P4 family phage/plasmid primase-like protien